MMIGDLSDCQLQSHSRATHLPALQARHRGQYPPPPEGSERGSAPCRHTDLSADWRHLRPLAATRSAIWQPKQVKQNSEGGKKWVCVLREPKLRNPNYSMFAKATILTIHFDQTLGA